MSLGVKVGLSVVGGSRSSQERRQRPETFRRDQRSPTAKPQIVSLFHYFTKRRCLCIYTLLVKLKGNLKVAKEW